LSPFTREFTERLNDLMTNPDQAFQDQVTAEGLRFTFNKPYGPKGISVSRFVNEWGLQWVVPFIRTPMNIAEEMLRMSPFSPLITSWREAILKGGVDRDRALAELAIGGGIMAVTMSFAFAGNISGAGSPDYGRRRGQYEAGWQAYSVKIGDKWYSYNRLQPVGTLIGIAADLSEVWDQMGDDERDQTSKMLMIAFANSITNQTFLQGLSQFTNALSDPDRYGHALAKNLAGSLIPNIIAQPTAMMDPLARETTSIIDAVKQRIPGLRQTLEPKIDVFGQDVEARGRVLGITPISVQQESTDQVRREIDRLAISVPKTPKKIHVGRGTGKYGEVELSPEQRTVYARASGKFAYGILSEVVESPNWQRMHDIHKRELFQRVFAGAHRFGAMASLPPEQRQGVLYEAAKQLQEELNQ